MHRFGRTACASLVIVCFSAQISGCALLIAGAAGGAAAGTAADVKEGHESEHSAAAYAGTVLANVLYVPAKVVFAAGGAAASGVTYIVTLGRPEPTRTIWATSTGGDYVMTPGMIEGREPIHFAATSGTRTTKVSQRGSQKSGA